MRRNHFVSLIGIVVLGIFLSACGGGGGGGESNNSSELTLADLNGVWYGAFRDEVGQTHTIQVEANDTGNITSVYIDGYNQLYGGTITSDGGNTFGYRLNNFYKTEGGFLLDDSATHMAFIDEDYAFGVMQKGATNLPGYSLDDLHGNWSGYTVELDSLLNVTDSYSSNVSVNTIAFTHSGSSERYGDFNGYLASVSSRWGYALGDWQNASAQNSGLLYVWMSPDKNFSASWACESGSSSSTAIFYITGCSFSMWSRQ